MNLPHALPKGATRIAKIPGYRGRYWITDNGHVWSEFGKGRWLSPSVGPRMYLKVDLCTNGKPKSCKVHRLVLAAYKGEPVAEKMAIAVHLNGDRRDNRVDNLKWGRLGETMWPLLRVPVTRYAKDMGLTAAR